MLLVFLVLAAQYESWSLPLVIILIVPMCLLSAIAGVWVTHGDNNVFTQIGLLVLVGLACKNAILIVEFARDLERQGRDRLSAALEASRIRLRPILMTSFAFIMGVVPLVLASGAGAEMRHVMGVAVFSGMLGVTFFGLVFTPLFYVLIRGLGRATVDAQRRRPRHVGPLRAGRAARSPVVSKVIFMRNRIRVVLAAIAACRRQRRRAQSTSRRRPVLGGDRRHALSALDRRSTARQHRLSVSPKRDSMRRARRDASRRSISRRRSLPTAARCALASRWRSFPGLTSRLPQMDLYDVGFDASWELDLFGRARRTRQRQRRAASSRPSIRSRTCS